MDLNINLEDRYQAGLRKWDKYGPDFMPAWVAEHDFGSPPAVHERLSHVLSLGAFGYHDEDRKLGESFAFWADRRNSWKLNPEQVVPTVTVLQGVAACVEAFSSVGDGVLYNTPSYPPFLDLPSHAKRRSVEWPLVRSETGWHYDVELLEEILKTDRDIRILLLCNPHNPTGAVLKESELSEIVNLCHKYNLTLLSDEIHSDFIYEGSVHIPTLTVDGADSLAISLTSGAKSFALAGMRCAIAVPGNDILKEKLLEVPKFLLGGANRMGCVATIAAWETGYDWMGELIRTLDDRRLHLKSRFDEDIPEARMFLPDSTFLAWIDLSEFNPGDKPAKWLREKTGIACGNGPDFGSGGENHVRLTFGTSASLLDEMIERIVKGLT